MRNSLTYIKAITLCVVALISHNVATAQRGGGGGTPAAVTPAIEWDKRAEIGHRLEGLGLGLMGESIDPHTGSLSFQHTDISLPGNSALPVMLTRQLTSGYFHSLDVDAEFGDWNYAVPRLHVVTLPDNYQQGIAWGGARCSNPQSTFKVKSFHEGAIQGSDLNIYSHFYPVDYSNGLTLDVPGFGSQQVLKKRTDRTTPFPSHVQYVTGDSWKLSCSTANDGGEGFIATAPNGNIYQFDTYVELKHRNMGSINAEGGNAGESRILERARAMLMASQVTDVHGNWVKYDYDGQGLLTQIHANDGRAIALDYSGTSKVITSATANGRTWIYNYNTVSISDQFLDEYANKKILSSVTQPEGQSWDFNLLAMNRKPVAGDRCRNTAGTVSLTHPSGATGTFDIEEVQHRKGWAEWVEVKTIRCSGAFVGSGPFSYYNLYHEAYENMAVTKKTITGSDIPSSEWIYTYERDVEETRYPVGHQYEGHPIATSENDPTNWTKVLNPDGSEITYYHFWNLGYGSTLSFSGSLDRKEIRSAPEGTILETSEYDYISTAAFGLSYIPNAYIHAPYNQILRPISASIAVRTEKTVTNRNGDSFTTEHDYGPDYQSTGYTFGNPTESRVWSSYVISNASKKRITTTTYEHKTDEWILGLPKTVTQNGRLLTSRNYTDEGQLEFVYQYNQTTPVATYTYHGDGTVATVTNAIGRITKADDWYRGKPETVTWWKGPSLKQTIKRDLDDNGWIMSQTDPSNYKTTYERDDMGRLTKIIPHTPAAGQGLKQLDTSISYNFATTPIIQMITSGNRRDIVNYDSLLRPQLEGTYDFKTTELIWARTVYDESGRSTFKSYPSTNAGNPDGIETLYDGLGRVKETREATDPAIRTQYSYLNGQRYVVKDPLDNIVTTYRYGYDGPDAGDPYLIRQPEDIDTFMFRNVHGEIWRASQNGIQNGISVNKSQYFYYDDDDNYRLCRYRTVEGGDTVYNYNLAGELTDYQKGLPAGTSCSDPIGNDKVTLEYDDLGRLTETLFADSATPNISLEYDTNGNVKKNYRGAAPSAVEWDYHYDTYNRLTSEHLTIDSQSFDLNYYYDVFGYMIRTNLPTGRNVEYVNDGLGRNTQLRWGSTNYVSSGTYHSNGAVAGFTFGEGTDFTQELNARQQVERLKVTKGGTDIQNLTFDYYADGRLQHKLDHLDPTYSTTHSYDGVGRLTGANNAAWGDASYTYDALGNIRTKSFSDWNGTSRTVTNNYNSKNQISSSHDTANILYGFGYDNRGNVTLTGGLSFTYDRADQPVTMSGTAPNTATAVTASYVYDGNLKRVKSVVNGRTIYNVYDAAGRLAHVHELDDPATSENDNNITDYLHGMGQTIARIKNGEFTYLHPDHLGSAQLGTNRHGAVLWNERYTPFGEALLNPAANDNQGGFTSHIKDKSTGLNYMQARYYDPNIGRFLSIDPVTFTSSGGNPGYFNRYAYTFNDPINNFDPNGMECVTQNTTTCGSSASSVAATAATSATAVAANEGIGSERARNGYKSAVSNLDANDSAGRSAAKQTARAKTPPITRGVIEGMRPDTGAQPGTGGTANRSSAGANNLAKNLGKVGRGNAAANVVLGGARIATAENPGQEAVVVGAETGGALGGAYLGAQVGAFGGPWGAAIGGVVGGIGGGFAGGEAADAAIETLDEKP